MSVERRLYHFPLSPFCRKVRLTLAEKKLEVELIEERYWEPSPDFLRRNPAGKVPVLRIDNKVLSESQAICEYLEEKHPSPALIGATAEQRAESRQWQRRVELNITEYLYNAFRYAEGYGLFKDRVHCIPDAAPEMKVSGQKWLKKLDGLMAGRQFVAGNELRLVDIVLYCCLDFAKDVGQPIDPANANVAAWFKRMDARPSAQSSLSANWADIKMRG